MMTIGESVDLIHKAKTKISRAKRVGNVHEDIEIMDGLVTLVETLQESLRDSASAVSAGQSEGMREILKEQLARPRLTPEILKVGQLPGDVVDGLQRARMDSRHDDLNTLMQDAPTAGQHSTVPGKERD